MTLTKETVKGVAVGSAMLLGASPNSTVGETELVTRVDFPSLVTEVEKTGEANIQSLEEPLHVELTPSDLNWTVGDARKLDKLAVKRAFLEATPEENLEFEQLQEMKRMAFAMASGTDALNEFRRRRFVNDLLTVLNRNATFFKAKDQKRLRAIGKTARS